MGSLGVVTGWWIYCLPHNEVSLLLLYLCVLAISSQLSVQFKKQLVFILVFVTFLNFSNLIRKRIILGRFQHLAIALGQ